MVDNLTSTEAHQWSVLEAVNWIAFRAEPGQVLIKVTPDRNTERFLLLDIIGAIGARAARDPRSWPPTNFWVKLPNWSAGVRLRDYPAWQCRVIVKRWMRETHLNATDLLIYARAEKHRYENDLNAALRHETDLSKALDEFNRAVGSSHLVAYGRPTITKSNPNSPPLRQPVPAAYIDEPRRINISGNFHVREDGEGFEWCYDPGPFYYDIQVSASWVKQLWPAKIMDRKIALVPCASQVLNDDKAMTWMRNHAQSSIVLGKKAKREGSISMCAKALKCTYAVAEAAYEALPYPELRNPPRTSSEKA